VRLLAVEQHIKGSIDVNADHIQQIISEWRET